MLELPETITMAAQLRDTVLGRRVEFVLLPTKLHKFCFFYPDVGLFQQELLGAVIVDARGFGIFAEISFDNQRKLCINDGVNLRLVKRSDEPEQYQLLLRLDDGHSLVFTVAMYGGISVFEGFYDNKYYQASRTALSPFSEGYKTHFARHLQEDKATLSVKAFMATEQRFPGIANGVLQDILHEARIHPKRKISTLDDAEQESLYESTVTVLREMIRLGGRDTEKDLFGCTGGYTTRMSKNSAGKPCTRCGTLIVKENYMGGSVYFCPSCQK